MTIIASKFSQGVLPTISGDCAGDVVAQHLFIDVSAAQLASGNIFDLGVLPAYNTVVDAILLPDDLDTGTVALTLDVGIMSGTPGDTVSVRTCGKELFDASVAAQTGVAARMSAQTGFIIKPTADDRSIGVKIVAAPGTAAAGRIRLRVLMAPADQNIQF